MHQLLNTSTNCQLYLPIANYKHQLPITCTSFQLQAPVANTSTSCSLQAPIANYSNLCTISGFISVENFTNFTFLCSLYASFYSLKSIPGVDVSFKMCNLVENVPTKCPNPTIRENIQLQNKPALCDTLSLFPYYVPLHFVLVGSKWNVPLCISSRYFEHQKQA